MGYSSLLLPLLLTLTRIWGRPSADLVTHLPGSNSSLTFEMYSGYLQGASPNIQLHYIFVEAANDSAIAPLVLWLNGGPGCSSLLGMFSENGPFHVRKGNQLKPNKYSWNKYANVVYLEAPAGVGFSFSYDGNVTTDDDLVADNNYFALTNFFEKFPEFKGRDFYIIGESYGGVYVPTLALRVADHPEMELKGIAVDNGLTSYTLNDNSLLYFAYYHSLIDASLWADLVNYCCGGKLVGRCMFTLNRSPRCQDAVKSANSILSYGLNVYNLYAPCDGGVPENGSLKVVKKVPTYNRLFSWRDIFTRFNRRYDQWLRRMHAFPHGPVKPRQSGGISREQADRGNLFRSLTKHGETFLNDRLVISCSDDSILTEYFNLPQVRSALNIPTSVQEWSACDNEVYTQYKRVYLDLSEQYRTLLDKGIRTHIFNGDVDMACNSIGDEWFVNDLGIPVSFTLSCQSLFLLFKILPFTHRAFVASLISLVKPVSILSLPELNRVECFSENRALWNLFKHQLSYFYIVCRPKMHTASVSLPHWIYPSNTSLLTGAVNKSTFVSKPTFVYFKTRVFHFKLKVPRHPWFFNATDGTRQIGGYTKSFLVEASNTTLTFSTVRGAGHMVPADKPLPAFTLYHSFLRNLH
ncbi:unnamed protein product [Hydatigera taeniaeformis]|uniref:Carboxypeptidase n=1 Tax=Hydatigena taeniaeformis TaxID=6205 RepID=A0A0R3X414_HYDTA|nr:unnamed protein product [Hydatigera taeniaeformis]